MYDLPDARPSQFGTHIRFLYVRARKAGATTAISGPVPLGPLSLTLEPGSYNAILVTGRMSS